MPAKNQPDLLARIGALRAEIDAMIDQLAAEDAKRSPGVPQVVLRNLITRNSPCQCRAFLIHSGVLK